MVQASTESSQNPKVKLLAEYKDAPGARKVERFFKPAAFSLEASSSLVPHPYKKRKYGLPAFEDTDANQSRHKTPRKIRGGRSGGCGGGRGSVDKNYRSSGGF